MKNTKRILVALLAIALLVSCMIFTVSAEDDTAFNGAGIRDIEDILEYYELENFVADNYENDSINTDYFVDEASGASVAADPTGNGNKVVKVTLPKTRNPKSAAYKHSYTTESLIASFDIYINEAMDGEFKLNVRTVDSKGVVSITQETLFSINAKENAIMYSAWNQAENNGAGAFDIVKFGGFATEADKWYNVVICFDGEGGFYNFKISGDGKQTWTESGDLSLGNIEALSEFSLTTYKPEPKKDTVSLYLDNVELYCGTFERFPAQKNAITAQTLLDLDALYNDEASTSETKVRIAEVLYRLKNVHNYVPEDTTENLEAVNAVITKIDEYVNNTFANELISRVNSINTSSSYYPRLEWANGILFYDEKVPEDVAAGIDETLKDAVAEAREKLEAEFADLAEIAAHSEAIVKAMNSYKSENRDYDGYLKGFYNLVSQYPKFDATYNESVEGVDGYTMTDAVADYEAFVSKFEALDATADLVIDGVTAMEAANALLNPDEKGSEAYENAWGELYIGYVMAKGAYNDGVVDENLDVATHAALSEKIVTYLALEPAIVAEIELCVQFNDIMKMATTATHYNAILEHLAAAKALVDVVRVKYPGVEVSKNLYAALVEATEGTEDASEAYINAVNAISADMSFADKRAAVNAALALKAAGDVPGIPGVKEANIKLSEFAAEIETLIGNSESLIAIVAKLDKATNLAERRALIIQANAYGAVSEPTYEGVSVAKAQLDTLISEFEADVNAANSAHADAVAVAADLAGAVISAEKIYKSASVIKDFVK